MPLLSIPVWKRSPFVRLSLPLVLGIIWEYYFQYSKVQITFTGIVAIAGFLLFRLLPIVFRFKLQALQGLLINVMIVTAGALLSWQKDIRHDVSWFGNYYHDSDYLVLTVKEPPTQKNKYYKANASVEGIVRDSTVISVTGRIILYFVKDSPEPALHYGDRILINRKLQEIQNSGNPGAFDYKRYAAFKQIFHNVFLRRGQWVLLAGKHTNYLNGFLFTSRQNILNVLHKNIKSNDDQLSIAEALLIGYTQDLDKDLVQAYSNTGVVHIIAISGMHLGLIYVILVWFFGRIPFLKKSKIICAVLVLSCLWLFAFLTGGGASILRSAVMFSCIVVGDNLSKKVSIYNSLAASAFILLCINPFFLWDVGFQLSYLALLGIVVFQKPVYHLAFIENKYLDKIWELSAVSIAAQIFTFPVCLYYFHQFPLIFLFTNLVTVPLSTVILFVEIFLIAFGWLPVAGFWAGKITWGLIWLMNKTILFFNGLPFALWQGIPATVISTLFLYFFVCSAGFWLLNKNKTASKLCLFSLLSFVFLNAYNKWNTAHQQKIIVYNIPQHQAIDFVTGNRYRFVGDPALSGSGALWNLTVKPSRIELQLNQYDSLAGNLFQTNYFFNFLNRRLLILDSSIVFKPLLPKINIDVIVLSKNPRIHIPQLARVFNCGQYIFDASNNLWKIEQWKKDCVRLHLPFHSVPEKGAFVMDL